MNGYPYLAEYVDSRPDRTAKKHRCPFCGRRTRKWKPGAYTISDIYQSIVVTARICIRCKHAPETGEIHSSVLRDLIASGSEAVWVSSVFSDEETREGALHGAALLSSGLDPFVAHRVHRDDKAFFEARPDAGVRVRAYAPGESLQGGAVVVVPVDRDNYAEPPLVPSGLIAVLNVRDFLGDLVGKHGLSPVMRFGISEGDLAAELRKIPPRVLDKRVADDPALANRVAMAVWPEWLKRPVEKTAPPKGTHASPRPHRRRGHWRTTKSGKKVWIGPMRVGGKPTHRDWRETYDDAVRCSDCVWGGQAPGAWCLVTRKHAGGRYWRRCTKFIHAAGEAA